MPLYLFSPIGSLDLSERSRDLSKTIDESCAIDLEPGLEAGSPSLDVEGLQGSADLGETETSLSKPEFEGDIPQARIAGPNMKPHNLQGSPSNLSLPSPKTKRAKCFSCVSKGDKGEPYTRGKTSNRMDWDRPSDDCSVDINEGGKFTDNLSVREPGISIPAKNVTGEITGPSLDEEQRDLGSNVQLDSYSPNIKTSQGRLKTQLSGPSVDTSPEKLKGSKENVDVPAAGGLNLPSSKKNRGNCFSCAGDGNKEDPYRKTKGNVGFDLSGPDGSPEMVEPRKMDITASAPEFHERGETNDLDLRTTGPDFHIEGPNKGISTRPPEVSLQAKDPRTNTPDVSLPSGSTTIGLSGSGNISSERPKVEIDANSPEIDGPKGRFDTEISAPHADISHGKLGGPKAKVTAPSGQLNLPSSKRKRGTCLSCAGDADKDDPYRKTQTQGSVGYNLSGPDGSLEMETPSKMDISASAPDFQGQEETKDLSFKTTAPDFDIEGPNKGISTGSPEISLHTKDPSINTPDVSIPPGSTDIGLSGTGDITSKRPRVQAEANSPDIDGPRGRFDTDISAPNADISQGKLRGPRAQVDAPSGELNVPSIKKKRVNCLSCAGDDDKDDPYGKTRGNVGYDFSGPDGSMEMEKRSKVALNTSRPDFQGHAITKDIGLKTSGPDFDIEGPNKQISTGPPEISLHAKDPSINAPDVSFPSGNTRIGLSGEGEISTERPRFEIEANSPDINGPKGGFDTDISAPGADISHGKMRGPKAQGNAPSGELNLPSTKRKGVNCLSCAGDGDKDDPYKKSKGNVGFDLNGPDGSLVTEKPRKVDISASAPDFQGHEQTTDLGFKTTRPDIDMERPNKRILTGLPEVSVHATDPSKNAADVSIPYGSTDIGLSGEGDISTKRSSAEKDANYPDIDGPEGRLGTDISAPDADVSHGKLRRPTVQGNAPSGELNLHSTKRKGVNCLSCAGDGDKDDPYKKSKGNVGFDLRGPDESLEMKKRIPSGSTNIGLPGTEDISSKQPKVEMQASSPDIDGRKGRFNTDISAPSDFDIEGENKRISTGPPEICLHAEDPSINTPDETFPPGSTNIGLSRTGDISSKRPKAKIDTNPIDIDASSGVLKGSKENVDVPAAGGLNLPSSKKNRGNCFSCAGDGNKEDPYRKTKGNVGFDLSGPDGSPEMVEPRKMDITASAPEFHERGETNDLDLRTTGPDFHIEGPNKGISTRPPEVSLQAKDPRTNTPDVSLPSGSTTIGLSGSGNISSERPKVEIDANSPEIDGPKGRFDTEISAPHADISHGKLGGPKAKVTAPSGQLNLPSSKRKRGTCLSCAGDADKDDPYRKTQTQGSVGYNLSGPDGSLEMETPSKMDISASAPDFQGQEETKDLSFKTTAPDFDIEGPNKGISTGSPEISLHTKDPSINTPDVSIPPGSTDIGLSGTGDITSKRPRVQAEANSPDIDGPRGRFDTDISAPNADISQGRLRDPRAQVDAPSGELNVPSTKRKGVNCLSCAGDGDKADPYRKTRGNVGYNFGGPDGSLEMVQPSKIDTTAFTPDVDRPAATKELELRTAEPDLDFHGQNKGISTGTPEISLHGKDPSINTPDVSIPSGGTGFNLSRTGNFSSERPSVEVQGNSPDIDGPEGRFERGISGPDVDVSDGKLQGHRTTVNAPSGELNLSSSKKKRVNCLACAGDGDEEDPYRKTKGSVGYNISGPDGSLEMEKPSKVDISTSGFDFDGRKTTEGLELSTIVPDVDSQRPKKGISLEPPDISDNLTDTDPSAEKSKICLDFPVLYDPSIGGSGFDAPKNSYETSTISGSSLGRIFDNTDIQRSKFDLDASNIEKPDFESEPPSIGAGIQDIKGPDFSHEKHNLSGPSMGRVENDIGIDGFDPSMNSSRVSVERPDISGPSFDTTAGDINLGVADEPSTDSELTGFDVPKPRGKEMHRTKPDIFMPSAGGISVHAPAVDLRQQLEADMKGLDVDAPELDFTVSSPNKKRASLEPVDMKGLRGKSFEGDVDWGISTSTPKDSGGIDFDANPVEGDVEFASTYDNIELHSKPESLPSVAYEEPHSLQRYDEIRPEMELRLLSPNQPNESDLNFDADISDANLHVDNWKPGEMNLVKVEENVTVCSASVQEPSSPSRILTLDREIKQRIELELPGHEGKDTPSSLKRKSTSSSSSSSSSSDAEDDKEKKSKRKKKSKLPQVFRKSSNSSASSKESGSSSKKKASERKSSTSSSSSDDDNEDQNRPTADFVSGLNLKKQKPKTSSSSSSSDEGSFGLNHQDLLKRKKSRSSSSSDEAKENDKKKQTYKVDDRTFTSVADEIKEPGKSGSITFDIQEEVTHDSLMLSGKISSKEQKPTSSSSSSDEEISSYNVSELNDLPKPKDQATTETKREEDDLPSSLDLSLHQYKAVDYVVTHNYASETQETNPSGVEEDPFVVVSRSLKRPYQDTEHEDELKVSSIELQFNEPPGEVSNHLDYPCRVAQVEEDDGAFVQEEDVVPLFKFRSLDYDVPDVSVLSKPSEESDAPNLLSPNQRDRVSPTWDVQAHTFEDVSHVTIQDDPPTGDENHEIREQSLIIVTRSLKRTSPVTEDADDIREEKSPNFSNTMEIQATEPSHDFYLEYPQNNKVFVLDEQNGHLTDEEQISQHTKEREIPDISAQLAALNYTEDEPRLKSDSPTKAEDNVKSPREKSPKEISRRGSNSRLWDLMQGYLIEQPILNDNDTNSESRSKNTEEHNEEGEQVFYETKPIEIIDSSISEKTQQSLNVVTYQIHIDDHEHPKERSGDLEDRDTALKASKPDLVSFDAKPVEDSPATTSYSTSITKVESSFAYVNLTPVMTETDSELGAVDRLDTAKDEHHTSVTDVKSSVQEVTVTSHSSQIEPISLQVDIGAIKPVSKYQTTSWKKEVSVPVDVDDKNDDPWMRHYSRGLQQGTLYQPLYAKSPERDPYLGERRGVSLSKVPHVKGVKTSGEKERERQRYSIEGRTSIQSASYQVSTDGKSMLRGLEAVPRVRTPESLFSSRDDREQSQKSQPESAGGDPSTGTSTSGPSVQSLRSFWDK